MHIVVRKSMFKFDKQSESKTIILKVSLNSKFLIFISTFFYLWILCIGDYYFYCKLNFINN